MEGRFHNQNAAPPLPLGGTNTSAAAIATDLMSVASSTSSTGESSQAQSAAASLARSDGSLLQVDPSMMIGESRSPSCRSVDLTASASGEASSLGLQPAAVERINPFEQAVPELPKSPKALTQRSESSSSSGNVKCSNKQTLPPLESTPISPDRSLPTLASNPSSPHPTTPLNPRAPSPLLNTVGSGHTAGSGGQPQQPQHAPHVNPRATGIPFNLLDDDENTEPSSALNSADPTDPASTSEELNANASSEPSQGSENPLSRFIEKTRRRISSHSSNEFRKDSPEEDTGENIVEDDLLGEPEIGGTLIGGYLQKLGRNGKWQTRWFETDGECLSYYKSEKRAKILATLDLEKVGSIAIDSEDTTGSSFTIQVLGRLYHLRADSKASCKDWVITLNRIKEARLQQGNVKLVGPNFSPPVDLLDTPQADLLAPRVVLVANRERTRAVEEAEELDQLIGLEEGADNPINTSIRSEKRLSTIGTVVYARWKKRKSSLSRLRYKFAKWARSLRRLGCISAEAATLDAHVHPPGHDDQKVPDKGEVNVPPPPKKKAEGLSGWIGKETAHSSRDAPEQIPLPSPEAVNRPRKMSTASEDIRVLS